MLISIGNVAVLRAAQAKLQGVLEATRTAAAEEDRRFCELLDEVEQTLHAAHVDVERCREYVRVCTANLERAEARLEEARRGGDDADSQ